MDMDWLEVGKVVGAQGLNGELRVYPNSDFPQRFIQPGLRWLRRSQSSPLEEVQLLKGRFLDGKGLYVIQLAGVVDRNQAEALRNAQLLVPANDRPPLEAGEFHVADLIGLRVILQATQESIGTVVNLFSAGNDLLEVELEGAFAQTSEPSESPESSTILAPSEISESLSSSESPAIPESKPHPSQRRTKTASKKAPKTKPQRKTVLIPFVEEIVPIVNLEAGWVVVNPPVGLL